MNCRFVLMAVLLGASLMPPRSFAKPPASCEDKEGVNVGIGIYLVNLAVVQSEYGSSDMDFYIYFQAEKCQYPDLNQDNDDEVARIFNNAGKSVQAQRINKFDKGSNTTTQFRIKGQFTYSSDISLWPFETQELLIAVEDPKNPKKKIRFHPLPDLTRVSPTVTSPGWIFPSGNSSNKVLSASTRDVTYPKGGTFSRYELKIALARPALNGFVKDLLPPIFICIVQFFSFAITPSDVVTRISMMGAGLTAAVLFHVQIAADRPPTTYLLFADKFMTAVYGIIVYNGVASALILHNLERRGDQEKAKRTQRRTEVIMLFAVPAIALALILDFERVHEGWTVSIVAVSICLGYGVSYAYDYKQGLLEYQLRERSADGMPLLSSSTKKNESEEGLEWGMANGAEHSHPRRQHVGRGYDEGDIEMNSSS